MLPNMNEQTEELSELEPEISEREKAEEALQKAHDELEQRVKERTHDLGERIKELNCLYGISKLIEKSGICLEEIIKGVVDIIPPSWQYPEVTCSRILLKDEAYKTENFQSTNWKQSSGIFVHGKQLGTVEVNYLEEKSETDEGPFLKEERNLINGIAKRLGRIIEWIQAEEEKSKLQNQLQQTHRDTT